MTGCCQLPADPALGTESLYRLGCSRTGQRRAVGVSMMLGSFLPFPESILATAAFHTLKKQISFVIYVYTNGL